MADTRTDILDAARDALRRGRSLSLDSVARAAGLTKPGLMYHFPTKQALMLALVDAVQEDWIAATVARLQGPPEAATARELVAAYFDSCVDHDPDPSDMVMLADPRLRELLTARWAAHMTSWFDRADEPSDADRGVLAAVRLMADGIWYAKATGVTPPSPQDQAAVRALAQRLLAEVGP